MAAAAAAASAAVACVNKAVGGGDVSRVQTQVDHVPPTVDGKFVRNLRLQIGRRVGLVVFVMIMVRDAPS